MVSKEEVLEELKNVQDPELRRSIVDLGMVRGVTIQDEKVTIDVALTVAGCPLRSKIKADVEEKVRSMPGVKDVVVNLGVMSEREREAVAQTIKSSDDPNTAESTRETPSSILDESSKTKVIVVASGKGGVGKSTVTVNLAAALSAKGASVGILDADIYGFSIPRMLGLKGKPISLGEGTILPLNANGIRVISIGSFVDEDTPVIWRGPLLIKALDQFLNEVVWGDPDYLLIDSPPGTGDIAISTMQKVPKAEVLIVTTPQPAASGVAIRVGNMAFQMNHGVLGVIENMSYFICDRCGAQHQIFGSGGGKDIAERLGVPLLGQIPLGPDLRQTSDEGTPEVISHPDSPSARAFAQIADKILEITKAHRAPSD